MAQRTPPAWAEVELAFFAGAPPEDPEPAAAPESFDDLVAPPSRPPWTLRWTQTLLAAARVAFRRRATGH